MLGDPAGWGWRAGSPLRFLHLLHSHTSTMKEHEKQRSEKLTCTDGYTLLPDTTASEIKKHESQEILKAPVSVDTLHQRPLSAPKHTFIFVTATLNHKKRSNVGTRDSLMPLCGICPFKDKCRLAQVYNKNDC